MSEQNNFLFLPLIKHELFGCSVRNWVIEVSNIEETAIFTVDFKIYSILIVAFPGKVLWSNEADESIPLLKICLPQIVTSISL
jgi:hypothetical protein